MTTIITRLYPDTASAEKVTAQLAEAGMPDRIVDVIAPSDSASEDMAAARVDATAAAAYGDHLTGSRRLVVVRAPFNPIGAARRASEIVDTVSSLDVGLTKEDRHIEEQVASDLLIDLKIMRSHPHMGSTDLDKPGWSTNRGLMSHKFGLRVLSKPKKRSSANSKGGSNFPMGKKIIRSTKHSVIEGGGHPFSNALGIPLLSFRNRVPTSAGKGTITNPDVS